jgi:phosphatidylethanolamine/phosphatidyl-N-methylethanolamine N-methyltransferase
MTDTARFWSRFAARYDGHFITRDAADLGARVARAVGAVDRVLDAGCGTGTHAVELAREARQVDAADFVEEMLAVARRKAAALGLTNVSFHQMGVDALAFPDGTFDAVVLSNVLHLVRDPARVLSEARRVLRPGGKLVAPSYCHAEGLKARVLSRVTALLVGVPILQRFGVERLLRMVDEAGFVVSGREVVPLPIPLVFLEAIRR